MLVGISPFYTNKVKVRNTILTSEIQSKKKTEYSGLFLQEKSSLYNSINYLVCI